MESVKSVAHKERAWIYCRVATLDEFTLKMQQEALNAYAENQLFEVVGATTEQSKGLSLMRDDIPEISHAAEQRLMDVLLVFDICRLGRNILEVQEYFHWLKNHGVRMVCMKDLM